MIGPQNLLDLNAPKVIWEGQGIVVALAKGSRGKYFEVVVTRDSGVKVADIVAGFLQLPQNALLRDAFGDDEDVCINFWQEHT